MSELEDYKRELDLLTRRIKMDKELSDKEKSVLEDRKMQLVGKITELTVL